MRMPDDLKHRFAVTGIMEMGLTAAVAAAETGDAGERPVDAGGHTALRAMGSDGLHDFNIRQQVVDVPLLRAVLPVGHVPMAGDAREAAGPQGRAGISIIAFVEVDLPESADLQLSAFPEMHDQRISAFAFDDGHAGYIRIPGSTSLRSSLLLHEVQGISGLRRASS